jgi:hypothetical protein
VEWGFAISGALLIGIGSVGAGVLARVQRRLPEPA